MSMHCHKCITVCRRTALNRVVDVASYYRVTTAAIRNWQNHGLTLLADWQGGALLNADPY